METPVHRQPGELKRNGEEIAFEGGKVLGANSIVQGTAYYYEKTN